MNAYLIGVAIGFWITFIYLLYVLGMQVYVRSVAFILRKEYNSDYLVLTLWGMRGDEGLEDEYSALTFVILGFAALVWPLAIFAGLCILVVRGLRSMNDIKAKLDKLDTKREVTKGNK